MSNINSTNSVSLETSLLDSQAISESSEPPISNDILDHNPTQITTQTVNVEIQRLSTDTAPLRHDVTTEQSVSINQEENTNIGHSSENSKSTDIETGKSRENEPVPFNWIDFVLKTKSTEEKLKEYGITDISNEFTYDGKTITVPSDLSTLLNVQKKGKGAFGTVSSILLEEQMDIPIAVKSIEYFDIKINEIAIMKDVCTGGSQYIIEYYCAFLHPTSYCLHICMEFMDTSLKLFYKTMHEEEQLSHNSVDLLLRRIVHDIASGLEYMERKEVLHRDIKPANMLINMASYVKLCDFGISRTFTRLNKYKSNSSADISSPLSPLLATENYKPVTVTHTIQDDMWSLGLSLLEIISNRISSDESRSDINHLILSRRKPCIPDIVCEDVQKIISDLLEEPEKRPQSYSDILDVECIKRMSDTISAAERQFVCHIINKISVTTNEELCVDDI